MVEPLPAAEPVAHVGGLRLGHLGVERLGVGPAGEQAFDRAHHKHHRGAQDEADDDSFAQRQEQSLQSGRDNIDRSVSRPGRR